MCRNYKEFQQFARMTPEDKAALIGRACLSSTDEKIAYMRLVKGADYIDIGAATHMERTGVSKRLRKIIVPKLEMFM